MKSLALHADRSRATLAGLALAVLATLCLACSDSGSSSESLADRGKRVYATNCTACHHPDPAQPGVIGPALAGKSAPLIRSMLVVGEPPGGYPPGKSGARMAPLPHLAGEAQALAAYLEKVAPAEEPS